MLWKYLCFFFTFIFSILTCIFPCRNESTTVPPPTTTTTTRVNTSTEVTLLLPEVTSVSLFNPTLGMMENFIQSDQRLKDYLEGFTNDLQRKIVETQIKFCPFISFCNISIDVDINQTSCCEPCQCDNCEGIGACCPSILPEEMFNITEVNSTDTNHVYTNLWKFSAAKNKEKTCISKQLTSRPFESNYGFLATADCPRHVDSILQHNCSRQYNKDINFESFLPVSSNSSLEIFRNKYCAACNGIAEEELLFFKPELVCNDYINILQTEKEITDILFSTNECSLQFRNNDPRVILSDCNNTVSTCNVTGLWKVYEAGLELACHTYESLFRHETYLFRNVFCVMCNGMDPHTINCQTDTAFVINTFSFSGLFRLEFDDGFTTSKDDKTVTDSSCTRNQIFDALMERCKDLTCPDMRKLQDGDCINIYESISYHFVYTVNIRLKPTSTLRMVDAFDEMYNSIYLLIHDIFDVKLDMCKVEMMFKSELKFGRSHSGAIATSSFLYIDFRFKFTKSYLQRPWDIVDNILKVHGRIINVGYETNSSQQYVVYVHDSDGRLLNIIEELFGSTSIYGDVKRASTVEERITILSEYAMSDTDGLTLLPFSVSMGHCGDVKKEIDVIRYSSCPKVNMSKMDITWAENLDGITINDLKINNTEFYYIDHDYIMICAEAFEKIMGHLQHQRVFDAEIFVYIVSASCSLSIICLLFTLVAFCVFPKLRTPLPGKNNMSLITALLIAHIMLLTGSLGPLERYSLTCKALGLLTHFSWLCSIFWMNVCTYHMFRVLTETKALLTGQGWKRFIRYHVYVVTMAVVLVLANVVSSVASSNGELGYGGKFCYLTSQKRILFTFVIPTSLITISNLIMFVFVVLRIKRSPLVHKSVKNDRNKLVILAKLSTITGLTWVFGIVYSFTHINTFSYIFVILNATQGLFIMFAFVINRRVFAMFKDLKIRLRDRIHLKASSSRYTISTHL